MFYVLCSIHCSLFTIHYSLFTKLVAAYAAPTGRALRRSNAIRHSPFARREAPKTFIRLVLRGQARGPGAPASKGASEQASPAPYSLFPIPYSLFTIHYSLFTIHCSLFTIHYSLFTIHCSLFTVHCSLILPLR